MSDRAEPHDLDPAFDLEAGAEAPLPLERDGLQPEPAPCTCDLEVAADEGAADDFARASIRRTVPAADAEPLPPVARLQAPVSIFNPATVATRRPIRLAPAGPGVESWVARVEREPGVVRMVRVRVEETAQWREKEEARRAKQRPPKPCAAMRRRKSAKLRKLLGIDPDLDD